MAVRAERFQHGGETRRRVSTTVPQAAARGTTGPTPSPESTRVALDDDLGSALLEHPTLERDLKVEPVNRLPAVARCSRNKRNPGPQVASRHGVY